MTPRQQLHTPSVAGGVNTGVICHQLVTQDLLGSASDDQYFRDYRLCPRRCPGFLRAKLLSDGLWGITCCLFLTGREMLYE